MKAFKILPLVIVFVMILSLNMLAVSAAGECICVGEGGGNVFVLNPSCPLYPHGMLVGDEGLLGCKCDPTKDKCTAEVKNNENCIDCSSTNVTKCIGKAPTTQPSVSVRDCICEKRCLYNAIDAKCPYCSVITVINAIDNCRGFGTPEFWADTMTIEGVRPFETVYSLDKGKKWLPIYSERLRLDSLATKKFELWVKATSDLENKNVKKFLFAAPLKISASDAPKVDNKYETVVIPVGYRYTIGLNESVVVTSATPGYNPAIKGAVIDVSALMDKGGVIAIQKRATGSIDGSDAVLPSLVYNIKVAAKPAAPKVVFDYKTDTVKVTDKMEYIYTKTGATASTIWIQNTKEVKALKRSYFGEDGGILKVRIAGSADGKKLKSAVATVVIPKSRPAPALTSDQGKDKNIHFDPKTSELLNVDDTMEYSVDGGTKWTAVKKGVTKVDVSKLFPAKKPTDTQKSTTLAVRYKYVKSPNKGGIDTHPSGALEFVINKYRPATPDKKVVKLDGTKCAIVGVDNTLEYRTIDGTNKGEWTAVAADKTEIDLSSVDKAIKFEIRVALSADYDTLPSFSLLISIPAPAAAPTAPVLNADKTVITKVASTMEYRLNTSREWISITGTSLDLNVIRDGVDMLEPNIYIRFKGKATALPSKVRKIEISPEEPDTGKPKAPTPTEQQAYFLERYNQIIFPDPYGFEFYYKGASGWQDVSPIGILGQNVNSNTSTPVKVLVRVKETEKFAASDVLEIIIAVQHKAPDPNIVKYDPVIDKIVGVVEGHQYLYLGEKIDVANGVITRWDVGLRANSPRTEIQISVKASDGKSCSEALIVVFPELHSPINPDPPL